jgi:hypothetical protein
VIAIDVLALEVAISIGIYAGLLATATLPILHAYLILWHQT